MSVIKLKKPIFYPGFIVYEDAAIVNRIKSTDIYDVFLLSNGKHVCLFLDFHDSYLKKIATKVKVIHFNNNNFHYLILEEYDPVKLAEYIDSIINPKGFDAVAGMTELKKVLTKSVIEPLRNPAKYAKFKLSILNGILLFGPPGCGKTYIVRKMAEEIGYHFIEVKHSDLASPYIHGMVKKIKDVFTLAEENKPSIIFFDEIDGLIPKKDSLGGNQSYKQEEINEFLMQFNDAGKKKILIVGATNKPNLIDEALLRPGRMDKIIYVGPPDIEAREHLFKLFTEGVPTKDLDYKRLSKITEGYASVDIEYIVKEASREAIEENKDHIDQNAFEKVIYNTKSSIKEGDLIKYNQYKNMVRK